MSLRAIILIFLVTTTVHAMEHNSVRGAASPSSSALFAGILTLANNDKSKDSSAPSFSLNKRRKIKDDAVSRLSYIIKDDGYLPVNNEQQGAPPLAPMPDDDAQRVSATQAYFEKLAAELPPDEPEEDELSVNAHGHRQRAERFLCSYGCGKRFFKKQRCHNHEKKHCQDDMFLCLICSKSFSLRHELISHAADRHQHRQTPKPQQGPAYASAQRKKPSPEPQECEYCSKTFASLYFLERHRRIHTGERPYICSFDGCDKTFSEKGNRRQHEDAVHLGITYPCPRCCKQYSREDILRRHLQKKHRLE